MFRLFRPILLWGVMISPGAAATLESIAGNHLPDIIAKPEYLASWNRLIDGEPRAEPWLKRYASSKYGTTVPGSRVALGDGDYMITMVCEPHNCGPRQFFVMFAPGGSAAWGILLIDTREEIVFGAPDAEKVAALRRHVRGDRQQ